MIEFVKGDFFDYDADIRVNTVNCVGVMGAGVALLFKNRYTAMFDDYAKACENNEIAPGRPHVWVDKTMFGDTTIINFPTKLHWKNPSEYDYVEKGLLWCREYLQNHPMKTITLPALGCGHGGLDWDIVKEMIARQLDGLDSRILVFEPSSSIISKASQQQLLEWEKENIHKLTPIDTQYPEKIKGKSGAEIFYKGNINLVSKKNISIIVNSQPEEREINALYAMIDEFPHDDFVFLLGYNSSYEIDLAQRILSKGFSAILVVPYGISNLKLRKDIQHYIQESNTAFISISQPTQKWKSYESINALKLRLKMSDVLLINSLHFEKFEKFEKEIKMVDIKKFYLNYWTDKIDFFSRISARKIGMNPLTRRPNAAVVIDSL